MDKQKEPPKAQSYLIIGKSQAARTVTRKVLKKYKITPDKISPDIFITSPLKNHITIDQIRAIKSHIAQKPVVEKFKVIILENAQKLTTEAQSALLKILEEPPKSVVVILEAISKSALLTTILSRVTTIETRLPTEDFEKLVLFDNEVFGKISQISDPEAWLDSQILSLHSLLIKKIRGPNLEFDLRNITQTIEKCAHHKEMIKANVNPKFAIVDLLLWIKKHKGQTHHIT